METLFLISRILVGGYFLVNAYGHLVNGHHMIGYAKSRKVPQPKMAIFLSGVLLLLGGLGILLWFQVQYAVFALTLFLVPVTFVMHPFWQETDPMAKMNENIAFTKNLALLGGVLAFLFI